MQNTLPSATSPRKPLELTDTLPRSKSVLLASCSLTATYPCPLCITSVRLWELNGDCLSQVLVCTESKGTADEDSGVEADARRSAVRGGSRSGGGCIGLGLWVAVLVPGQQSAPSYQLRLIQASEKCKVSCNRFLAERFRDPRGYRTIRGKFGECGCVRSLQFGSGNHRRRSEKEDEGRGWECAYHSLQAAHKQTLKNLARLIAVAYILESFC
jgi:hypothetical protein